MRLSTSLSFHSSLPLSHSCTYYMLHAAPSPGVYGSRVRGVCPLTIFLIRPAESSCSKTFLFSFTKYSS